MKYLYSFACMLFSICAAAQCGAPGGLYIVAAPETCYGENNDTAYVANFQSGMQLQWFNNAATDTITAFGRPSVITCLVYNAQHTLLCSLSDSLHQPAQLQVQTQTRCPDIYCNVPGYVSVTPLPQINCSYQYSTGDTSQGEASDLHLSPGSYTVTVTVPNGCPTEMAVASFTIPPATPITVTELGGPFSTSCYTPITFKISGLPDNGILYSITEGYTPWGGGSTSTEINSQVSDTITEEVGPGVFRFFIQDDGCPAGYRDSAFVIDTVGNIPFALADTVINAGSCSPCNGAAWVAVRGGIPPFKYQWSCSALDTTYVTGICPGSYIVRVTDSAGCQISNAFNITNTGNPVSLSTRNSGVACATSPDTTVLSTQSVQPCNITWGDGTTSNNVVAPQTHIYPVPGVDTILVTDTFGCHYKLPLSIPNTPPVIYSSGIVSPYCNAPDSGSVRANVDGGHAPYQYIWNNADTGKTISNLSAGNYSVTVTDRNGCTTSGAFVVSEVNVGPGYYVYVNATGDNCSTNGQLSATVYGGYAPLSYKWNIASDTLSAVNAVSPGTYAVTVTDSIGCVVTGTATVDSVCNNYITGETFIDTNGNCILNTGEQPMPYVSVVATQGNRSYYGYSDGTGRYIIAVPDTGVYAVYPGTYNLGTSCLLSQCPPLMVDFAGMGDTVFNINPGTDGYGFDLSLHPGWSAASPGGLKNYWIMPFNNEYTPHIGADTIVFNYDPALIFEYIATPYPNIINTTTHTLTWIVDSVPYPTFNWANDRIQCTFYVPATLPVGYLLQSTFTITPTTGDCNPANNTLSFSDPVNGSHDPNHKSVSPAGGLSNTDSVLTYTINFENTGTATSNFVVVKDTLSPYLNPASVVTISSSAPYTLNISGTGVLTWTFNPLHLTDSLESPDSSKGFIIYTVKRFSNAPLGSIISNRASIYFDYNAPVITNTISDTVTSQPAGCTTLFTTLNDSVCTGDSVRVGNNVYRATGNYTDTIYTLNGCDSVVALTLTVSTHNCGTGAGFRDITTEAISVYPNPANDKLFIQVENINPQSITIYDVNGRLIYTTPFKPELDVNQLSSGVYFIEVTSDLGVARKMFVKM